MADSGCLTEGEMGLIFVNWKELIMSNTKLLKWVLTTFLCFPLHLYSLVPFPRKFSFFTLNISVLADYFLCVPAFRIAKHIHSTSQRRSCYERGINSKNRCTFALIPWKHQSMRMGGVLPSFLQSNLLLSKNKLWRDKWLITHWNGMLAGCRGWCQLSQKPQRRVSVPQTPPGRLFSSARCAGDVLGELSLGPALPRSARAV